MNSWAIAGIMMGIFFLVIIIVVRFINKSISKKGKQREDINWRKWK